MSDTDLTQLREDVDTAFSRPEGTARLSRGCARSEHARQDAADRCRGLSPSELAWNAVVGQPTGGPSGGRSNADASGAWRCPGTDNQAASDHADRRYPQDQATQPKLLRGQRSARQRREQQRRGGGARNAGREWMGLSGQVSDRSRDLGQGCARVDAVERGRGMA